MGKEERPRYGGWIGISFSHYCTSTDDWHRLLIWESVRVAQTVLLGEPGGCSGKRTDPYQGCSPPLTAARQRGLWEVLDDISRLHEHGKIETRKVLVHSEHLSTSDYVYDRLSSPAQITERGVKENSGSEGRTSCTVNSRSKVGRLYPVPRCI
ncbi:hypothetical protein VTK26DRAFT_3139 [Humicola hyalothermophila]